MLLFAWLDTYNMEKDLGPDRILSIKVSICMPSAHEPSLQSQSLCAEKVMFLCRYGEEIHAKILRMVARDAAVHASHVSP